MPADTVVGVVCAVILRRGHGCLGRRSGLQACVDAPLVSSLMCGTVIVAGMGVCPTEGGGARQVMVVGIEASTAADIASTGCAGANAKGSWFIHFIFAVCV